MPFLGIEIGGTKLQLFVGEPDGIILDRKRFQVNPRRGGSGIRDQIEEALPAILKQWNPAGVCVGFGGPVDWHTGRISRSHQIEGWADFPLGSWLETLTSRKVRVDNDANLGALGEATCGAGKGLDPAFYVTLGSGVGGGLVVSGEIYHGSHPGESEIGHLRLDRKGTLVEQSCSGWAVDAKIRASDSPTLRALTSGMKGGEARVLAQALDAKDAEATRILRETAGDLAFGLSHVVHLFHPAVIVLGGGFSLLGEPLRAAVADQLPTHIMKVFRDTTELRLAVLGEDAVPVGCLVQAGKLLAA